MGRLSRAEAPKPRLRRLPRSALATLVGGLAFTLVATAPGTATAAARGWEKAALSLPQAHAVTQGDGVKVAVIDTGIRTGHPALNGRVTNGPDMLQETDQDASWYGAHGTAMASNVLEAAPRAKVLGLRAIRDDKDPDYETWKESVENGGGNGDNVHALSDSITYAVKHGAKVISMSLGSDAMFSHSDTADIAAISYALSKGVTVVVAAGNSGDLNEIDDTGNGGGENNVGYPAAYPGVLTVAATQPGGQRTSFSSVHNYVDIAAPGTGIYSADYHSKGLMPIDGTSSATALTSGVVALLLSKYPDLSPAQVSQVLRRTAAHPGTYSPTTGYGEIDAAAALRAAVKVKGTRTVPVGTKGAGAHFGSGDDGVPARIAAGLDSEYVGMAAAFGGPGLLALIGGILLLRRGRKARGAAPAAPVANWGAQWPGAGPGAGWGNQ